MLNTNQLTTCKALVGAVGGAAGAAVKSFTGGAVTVGLSYSAENGFGASVGVGYGPATVSVGISERGGTTVDLGLKKGGFNAGLSYNSKTGSVSGNAGFTSQSGTGFALSYNEGDGFGASISKSLDSGLNGSLSWSEKGGVGGSIGYEAPGDKNQPKNSLANQMQGAGGSLSFNQRDGVSASVSASGGVNAGNWSQSGGFQANTNFLTDQWKADFQSGKAQEDAAAQEASRTAQNRNNSESGKSVLDGAAISTQRREENILDHVLNKAGDALGGALDWVGNKIDGAIDSVVGAASSAWDGVKNFASSAVESIGSATLGLGKVNISTNPLDYISGNGFKAESGGGFFGGLKGKLGNIGEGISGFFSGDSKSDSNSVTNRDGNQTQDTTRNYTVEGAALKLQLESGQIQPAEYNKKVAELNKVASTDTAYLTKRGEKIVQIAEGYLDKGFTYPKEGQINSLQNKVLDCTGFTHAVYSQYGIDLGASIKGTSGIENDTKNFTKVKESQRLPGDIYISTVYSAGKLPFDGHAYIYTGKTGKQEFIQSSPNGIGYTGKYLPSHYEVEYPGAPIRSGYYRPKPTNLEMVKE
nr:hypothetical protein [Leptospira santarosai]